MPGDNCSVFGCGSCRRTKGIGIWKLPAPLNDDFRKWREAWLNEQTKYRVIDKDFQNQIDNDKVFTCEKDFKPEDIEIFKSTKLTKKQPKFGALPCQNMPKKGHPTTLTQPRPARIVRESTTIESARNRYFHSNFPDFCKKIQTLKCLSEWRVEEMADRGTGFSWERVCNMFLQRDFAKTA